MGFLKNEVKNNRAKKKWESKTEVEAEMRIKEKVLGVSSSQDQKCP